MSDVNSKTNEYRNTHTNKQTHLIGLSGPQNPQCLSIELHFWISRLKRLNFSSVSMRLVEVRCVNVRSIQCKEEQTTVDPSGGCTWCCHGWHIRRCAFVSMSMLLLWPIYVSVHFITCQSMLWNPSDDTYSLAGTYC